MHVYEKRVLDPDRFLRYLRENGLSASGVAIQGSKVYIQHGQGEHGKAASLVKAYTNQPYYKIVGNKSLSGMDGDQPCYRILRNGEDTCVFTISKHDGDTDALIPSDETVHIHWHGTRNAYLSSREVQLVKGKATVEIGKIFILGGGFLEAVHPREEVVRAIAWLLFE